MMGNFKNMTVTNILNVPARAMLTTLYNSKVPISRKKVAMEMFSMLCKCYRDFLPVDFAQNEL